MKKSLGAKPLAYPAPTFAVGSYDENGKPNAMIAAWGGICCSTPPCICIAIRPGRHGHTAILKRKAFTVCVPDAKHVAEADYLGIVSGKNADKFATANLTAVKGEFVDAPYIEEFPVAIECSLLETVELGAHTLLVGEIKDVKADEAALGENGLPDMPAVDPVVFSPGSQNYYGTGELLGKAFSIGKKFKE